MLSPLSCKLGDTLHQDGDLHKLDILERRVPEDVYVSDNESGTSSTVFEESNNANIVSGHDSIEDIVFALHIRTVDGCIGKVDELLVQQDVPGLISGVPQDETDNNLLAVLVEDGTPIDQLCFPFCHGTRS